MLCAAFCERLLEKFGTRLMGPIAILRNWTFCLFYVMAELWGSVVVSLLFWGFANQVCWVLCAPCICGPHAQVTEHSGLGLSQLCSNQAAPAWPWPWEIMGTPWACVAKLMLGTAGMLRTCMEPMTTRPH